MIPSGGIAALRFPAAAFAGAFLLLLVQPMAGKALLPLFGGSISVWSVALIFFQGILLAGYLIPHLLIGNRATPLRSLPLPLLAAAAAIRSLALPPFSACSLETGSGFVASELRILLAGIGLPALALAATCPSVLRWQAAAAPADSAATARILAASNAGSLAGLIAFPLLLEPAFAAPDLWRLWSFGILGWAALFSLCAPLRQPERTGPVAAEERPAALAPEGSTPLGWALPAMAGTALLAAVTNVLTLDVAAIPFLWVVPLAVYLWTWVRAFGDTPPDLHAWGRWFPDVLAGGFVLALVVQLGFTLDALIKGLLLVLLLWASCTVLHGLAAQRRPVEPDRLTAFSLCLSAGGLAGTLLTAFVPPLIGTGLIELPLALGLAATAGWLEKPWRLDSRDPFAVVRISGLLLVAGALPTLFARGMPDTGAFLVSASAGAIVYIRIALQESARRQMNRAVTAVVIALCLVGIDRFGTGGLVHEAVRTWYGIYRVFDNGGIRYLQMGSTYHGHEAISGPDAGKPLYYYHPETPIGGFFGRAEPTWRSAAVVGLGAGTLAAYAKAGQRLDFYELDPACERIARTWFGYLGSSAADIRVIPGDGRLGLRAAEAGLYDLIVLDAFNSDAIPVHLLTTEAIREYRRALAEDGLLLFHISNRHLNLAPVLFAAAGKFGLDVRLAQKPGRDDAPVYPTRWIAMGSHAGIRRHLSGLEIWRAPSGNDRVTEPWTDSHSSLLAAFPPDQSLFTPPPATPAVTVE